MEPICVNARNMYKIHFRFISNLDILLSGEMGMLTKFCSETTWDT
jgi:hypothetical protein